MKKSSVKHKTKPQSDIEKILSGYPEMERENLRAILKKYRRGEAARWQVDELRTAGLIEPRPAAADNGDALADATSTVELAARLSRHFQGRISIDLSAPALAQWRRGRGLPPGTPLPPARVNNRHKTAEWAAWLEKHLLPKYGVSANRAPGDMSIFEQAQIAEAERKINEAAIADIDRRVAEGAFQSAELFISHLRHAGTVINQAITNFVEKGMAEKLIAATDAWNLTPEQKLSLHPVIHGACQKAADGLREALQRALTEAEDKTE